MNLNIFTASNSFTRRSVAVLVLVAMLGSCAYGNDKQLADAMSAPAYQLILPVPPRAPKFVAAPQALVANVTTLGTNFQGKVGIAVHSIDQGWTVQSNGETRMPQQSVSKLWVAMTVLDFRDAGRLKLDDPVTIRREDLTLFHQPVAALVKGDGYQTTVGELLQRALTMSDNTCNDRLLQYVGGPAAVRAFIARKNLGDIRFGPGERLLQSATAGLEWKPEYAFGNAFNRARDRLPKSDRIAAFDRYVANPPDGAAPLAIAGALAKLKQGKLLSASSTDYLIGTMESSRTGKQRMHGAVPPGWSFGHKTGTGQDLAGRTAGYNDVGVLMAPDGRSYSLAVMIGDTPRPIPERQALMQAVVAAVVMNHG
ncbi:serine hydrolase [Sphingomonas sp. Leaf357]|uniref:serine hydrolase n=1 Tax=Sphingomonas sp. Leaf357 TaxID=1736350 RepID=UPI0006F6A22C|nr:serine hydrolase [Sphingomonas sp. Leaf357]KQS03178.1 serine hydrolase [Sphingomonas sp. Leaf357]